MMNERTEIIDINESRHRYHFTREATQKEINQQFNVQICTLGKYYPDRSLSTPSCPPLAVQIRGASESVSKALDFITTVLKEGPLQSTAKSLSSPSAFTRKIYLGFVPEPGRTSAVRSFILGPPPAASHLRHIVAVCGVNVQLRGQGSGFIEPGMTVEQLSDPMHLHVTGNSEEDVCKAELVCDDLCIVTKHYYDHHRI